MPEKRNDIGALWENTTRDGRVILKGTINGEKVVGFRNEYKKEDRHPDWKFYPDMPKDGQPQSPPKTDPTPSATPQQAYTTAISGTKYQDDEIPF